MNLWLRILYKWANSYNLQTHTSTTKCPDAPENTVAAFMPLQREQNPREAAAGYGQVLSQWQIWRNISSADSGCIGFYGSGSAQDGALRVGWQSGGVFQKPNVPQQFAPVFYV